MPQPNHRDYDHRGRYGSSAKGQEAIARRLHLGASTTAGPPAGPPRCCCRRRRRVRVQELEAGASQTRRATTVAAVDFVHLTDTCEAWAAWPRPSRKKAQRPTSKGKSLFVRPAGDYTSGPHPRQAQAAARPRPAGDSLKCSSCDGTSSSCEARVGAPAVTTRPGAGPRLGRQGNSRHPRTSTWHGAWAGMAARAIDGGKAELASTPCPALPSLTRRPNSVRSLHLDALDPGTGTPPPRVGGCLRCST
jgi:hypothetical protein